MAINGVGNTGVVYQPQTTRSSGDPIIDMINQLTAGSGAPIATESMFDQPSTSPMDLNGGSSAPQSNADLLKLLPQIQSIAQAGGPNSAIGAAASFLAQGIQLMNQQIDPTDTAALAKHDQDMKTFMQFAMNPMVQQQFQQIIQVANMSPQQVAQMQADYARKDAEASSVLRQFGYNPDLNASGPAQTSGNDLLAQVEALLK